MILVRSKVGEKLMVRGLFEIDLLLVRSLMD
jgi:hypothetical protein